MRWLWLVGVVLVLAVGAAYVWRVQVYWATPVTVRQEFREICVEPGHRGNRVLSTSVRRVRVPRRQAELARLPEDDRDTCQACQDRLEREARREEVRRRKEGEQARQKAEVVVSWQREYDEFRKTHSQKATMQHMCNKIRRHPDVENAVGVIDINIITVIFKPDHHFPPVETIKAD